MRDDPEESSRITPLDPRGRASPSFQPFPWFQMTRAYLLAGYDSFAQAMKSRRV